MSIFVNAAAFSCAVTLGVSAVAAPTYPTAPKQPVADTYHGVSVTDDYQWLEDATKPEFKAWVAAQNKEKAPAL